MMRMGLLCAVSVALTTSVGGFVSEHATPPVDVSESKPGGAATSRSGAINRNAFSQSSGNLTFEDELRFKLGNAIFRKLWVSSPASTKSSDGLGPLYNARSCQRCHLKDGRGHPPKANWPDDNAVSLLMRLSIPPRTDAQREQLESGRSSSIPSARYGGQLQDFAVQGHDAEGRIRITYQERQVALAGGDIVSLRVPGYALSTLRYGDPDSDLMMSPRIAPQMIGLGLLEAVSDKRLLEYEDPDDSNNDGISGRANRVWSLEEKGLRVGRFGWKAGMPTLRQQAAAAFSGDIGISTRLFTNPSGDCMASQRFCLDAPNGAGQGHEVDRHLLNLVTFYTRNLAVPPRRKPDDPDVRAGRDLFHQSGCATCHRPKLETGETAEDANLRGQTIWPYSDLLLHDMGEELADGRPEARADGREWRTPPLWGIGLTQTVSGHTFLLHDGRARNVLEAILWHGGEAEESRKAFAALPLKQRRALIAFVNSL